ncbi:MAG: MlaD family protein [Pseudolabrys sp.]|nr:MlaD family protein [Pseudolabrys sp.]
METRANYVLIGVFTLAVIIGVFGFIYWFQNIGSTGERAQYRIQFDGSVSGLRTGASVLFNGIRVGEVTGLVLNPEKPQQVIATISVDRNVAIRSDTEIGLEFQGLTGIAALSLKGGNPASPVIASEKDKTPPLLVAPPGATQDVTAAARDVLRKLEEFITTNQKAFAGALGNIEKFTETLANNSDHIDNTLASIDKFSSALGRNSERFDRIAEGIEGLTGGPDGKGGEINAAAKSIRELAERLDQRTAEITAGISRLSGAGARQIEAVSSDARRTLSEVDRTVRNFDRNPSRLLFGGGTGTLPEYNGRR